MEKKSTVVRRKEEIGPVKSFETARGSIYTYDNDGKTRRFKTVDGEWQDRMDITVFIPVDDKNRARIIGAYSKPKIFSFHLVEVQGDEQVPIYSREDVKNPENLRFCVLNISQNKWAFSRKASLTPTIGSIVYEQSKSIKDDGKFKFHLGHEVINLNY